VLRISLPVYSQVDMLGGYTELTVGGAFEKTHYRGIIDNVVSQRRGC
jgi:hypothetical protein